MKKRVADIVMDTLAQNNVTDAFCVVGGGAMFLNNALGVSKKIKTIFNHHEQGSAMAAAGYARYNQNKMALVCVTSGPGGTNALTGVMGAYQDNLPMIVISGQVRYDTTVCECELPIRQRGEQEFDIVNSIGNMTKYRKMVTDPKEIKREVKKAIDIAMSGRRGPVWLDIPLNVQSAVIEEKELLAPLPAPEEKRPSKTDLNKVLSLLKGAKRPAILAGSAIRSSGERNNFIKFLKQVKIPVVGAACMSDVLYTDHPLYFGTTGTIGSRSGNFILQNCDVLLVLGSRLGFKQTGFAQENFAPKAKIIMVDIDAAEPKKPGLRIFKFLHSALSTFFTAVSAAKYKLAAPKEWMSYCNGLKERFSPFCEVEREGAKERVNSAQFWEEYYKQEKQDSAVILGNSSSCFARLHYSVAKENQRTMVNINCGSMGDDVPQAIGACVAAKKEVICSTGDGSLMMNLQELATIKHNNLPVKLVIFSNEGYAAIRMTCKTYFDSKNVGCSNDSGLSFPDFKKIADAFGFPYKLCKNTGEIKQALKWLDAQKSFAFLEVLQKYENPPKPRLMSKLNKDGSFDRPSLENMFPFLSDEEMKKFNL
ncbi:acetolactate synthase-1/2/3 large subunit [Elusimicrobium posterum]|uniref:thiamine pyrophosphate-binding protein n=1 Tax=Elusimicrobium posterum TaxID=3116653 RepID=UPI003C718890